MILAAVASFRTRPLATVERLSLGSQGLAKGLVDDGVARGAIILSTCNRFEVYLDVADADAAWAAVVAALSHRLAITPQDAHAALDELRELEAVAHLANVAASLDSMVVGEQEISGQVRRALKTARAEGTATGALTRLFEQSIRTSRSVAAATGLGTSHRSVASVALDLASRTVEFQDAKAIIIGTGQLAASGVAELRARGVDIIGVFSPSGRARDFGELYAVDPLGLEDLNDALAVADLIYACSGGEGVVLSAGQLAAARNGRPWPLTVVDLALHRDLDPSAAALTGVSVVSLEDVRSHAPHASQDALDVARTIVGQAAESLAQDLRSRSML